MSMEEGDCCLCVRSERRSRTDVMVFLLPFDFIIRHAPCRQSLMQESRCSLDNEIR